MTAVTFTVEGPPVAKARHRMRRTADGTFQPYTDAKTREGQEMVQWAWRQASARSSWPVRDDVAFSVTVDLYVSGAQVPDVDNFAKLVMDALNGLAWHDDRQVTRLYAAAHHNSAVQCTVVTVESCADELPVHGRPRRRRP